MNENADTAYLEALKRAKNARVLILVRKCPLCGEQFVPSKDKCPNCGADVR